VLSVFDHRPILPDTGCGTRIFERELAVDEGFEIGPCDRHFQVMPPIAGEVPWFPPGPRLTSFRMPSRKVHSVMLYSVSLQRVGSHRRWASR
jgi:hypothetical protein